MQIIKSSPETPNSIKKTRNIDFQRINDIFLRVKISEKNDELPKVPPKMRFP